VDVDEELLDSKVSERKSHMIKTIEIERFSLTTSKPFAEVVAGVNAAVGHPDMAEFFRATRGAGSLPNSKTQWRKV